VSSLGDNFDDNFSPWKQSFVQQALSQVTVAAIINFLIFILFCAV
jgi:hypothetical protein